MEPLILTNPDGSQEILYRPHPKQAEFHARTEPNVLMWGGRGSGKSVALRWEAHIRAMSTPGFTYCILRRTYPELQKSHLLYVAGEMRKLGGHFLHGDKIAVYPNGSKGFYSHCSDETDVLNLLSAQFAWMGFDELSTFPWEMFTKLSASVRVPFDSNLIAMVRACTNPLGASAEEINHYFIEKDVDPSVDPEYVPEDWYNIRANLEDNPSIDAVQYRKRFSGQPAYVRKAWLDGEFVTENALFDFYPDRYPTLPNGETGTIRQPYHVIPRIEVEELVKKTQIYRAYDHGYFPDPAVCLWIAHLGNRYIVFHEKTWTKTVAADIAADIKAIDKSLGIERVVNTYCDPTMDIHTGHDIRTLRDIFESHGVPMEPSLNNREMYATSIHQALSNEIEPNLPKLQIYAKGAPYLVKSIPQMRFNPKKTKSMDNHHHDHPVVALAYFLMSQASYDHNPAPTSNSPIPRWMRPKLGERDHLGTESVRD